MNLFDVTADLNSISKMSSITRFFFNKTIYPIEEITTIRGADKVAFFNGGIL